MIGGSLHPPIEAAADGANARSIPVTGERAVVHARWVSVPTAARMLGISEAALRRQIRDRMLTAVRAGRSWRVLLPSDPPPAVDEKSESTEMVVPRQPEGDHSIAVEQLESMVALVRDLQRQNLALAGHIGFLQSRLQGEQERAKLADARRQQVEHQLEDGARLDPEEHQTALDEIDTLRRRVGELEEQLASSKPVRRRWWRRK